MSEFLPRNSPNVQANEMTLKSRDEFYFPWHPLSVYLAEGNVPGADGGAIWQPQAGQPGFIPYAAQNKFTYVYQLISDVPEPSSLALFGLAGVVALLRKRD